MLVCVECVVCDLCVVCVVWLCFGVCGCVSGSMCVL